MSSDMFLLFLSYLYTFFQGVTLDERGRFSGEAEKKLEEVADLARLNLQNIGKLMGYCIEGVPFTRMLVFEYASNGTLSEHLHWCQPLSWTRRMTIIVGISKGLKYLHTEIEPPFTIYELNSSAVYLTEDFSAK